MIRQQERMGWLGTVLSLAAVTGWCAGALEPSATQDQVDTAHCAVLKNGKPGTLDEPRMLYALGLQPTLADPWRRWSAGTVEGESRTGETFRYVAAFKQPVTVGAVLTTSQKLAWLKPDAPYPGDPANPEQWDSLDVPAQSGPRLVPLPAAVQTRAVIFTDVLRSGYSQLGPVRLFKLRLFNPAPLAGVRAKTEYAAPENFGAHVYRAIDVVRGRGSWV